MSAEDKLVVIFMGSEKDRDHIEKMEKILTRFSIPYRVRALSAHKLASDVLKAVEKYEGMAEELIFIAVAGRSNALGPAISGHSKSPVINCPPLGSFKEDLFSSLRTPSAVPCSTVLDPGNAALHAVKIFALRDEELAEEYVNWREDLRESLRESDRRVQQSSE